MRPRLETRSGTVEGILADGLCQFRGVPFARPPVGARRWRAPEPCEPWSGVRDASRFAPAAPQNGSVLLQIQGIPKLEQSEDCLYLNVWTPALDDAARPVLVWIHGGGFRSGTGSEPIYEAARLAREGDVVVVTLNYRLGALGFLALPTLSDDPEDAANCGLLDQVAALRWVHEHADRLGGDASRVAVFGQSAGAMSVGALLAAPCARPWFRRAILQSGAAHNVSPAPVAARVAETFTKELGLGPERADELRTVPLAALLEAQKRTIEQSARFVSLAFQPYVDGRVLPRQPLEAIAAGDARGIEVLIGTNLDEWNLFGFTDARSRNLDEERLQRRLMRAVSDSEESPEQLGERVRALYRGAPFGGDCDWSPPQLWSAIESDRFFHLPARRLAELQSAVQPRTYQYLFTWRSPAAGGTLGACHGLEIPFVFGTLGNPLVARFAGGGDAAQQLSRVVQDAWCAFARAGNPADGGSDRWSSYDAESRATMILGAQRRLAPDPLEERVRFWSRRA